MRPFQDASDLTSAAALSFNGTYIGCQAFGVIKRWARVSPALFSLLASSTFHRRYDPRPPVLGFGVGEPKASKCTMASLPSYQEAVSADWLRLVVPYLLPRDYPALCRVNRRFWATFAPLLWGNILRSRQSADVDSVDDLEWWLTVVFAQLYRTRPDTRRLIRVFDSRHLLKGTCPFDTVKSPSTRLRETFSLLPNLSCFLIDGHQDLNPAEFLLEAGRQVVLLSMANCPILLPAKFVNSLPGLVYLDISGIPGSVRPFLQRDLLPELRVLKIRNKEVDDAMLDSLAAQFGTRLWSLDVSSNKLTDRAVESLGFQCLWPADLRSDANFEAEGKLEFTGGSSPDYGNWVRLNESPWSGSFNHPDRHCVDAPSYDRHDTLPQEGEHFRSDGQGPIQPDSADGVCRGLQGEDTYFPAESFQSSLGLTHLNLSDNHISSLGVRKLLTLSCGHLQQLSCDSMSIVPASRAASQAWPRSTRLFGFFSAYTLRPVFSSNLRVVRLHHSVVTQIPTLEIDDLSTMARLLIAETSILSRSEKAFPQAFVPDMNPRIKSLTLTRIPRRSCGPLINKLVNLLKLLSTQERKIFDATSRHGPGTLAGLRHLRLEFEPDPYEEGFSTAEDLDAEELMNSGDGGFSFFDDDAQRPHSKSASIKTVSGQISDSNMPFHSGGESAPNDPEYLDAGIMMDRQPARAQVWIGPKWSSQSSRQPGRVFDGEDSVAALERLSASADALEDLGVTDTLVLDEMVGEIGEITT
ncbi:hypothetical protein FZEAL_5926 [Fusarium zealandicum]|uniref:Leucine rich repeat domain containing protein n=1 Tax=Fusarium zealandicum TaxID=1053134 RepID=A0A8H4UJG8_9HYPO|nr:hypothetical protein FZEAL_5926 [Fusarium zealandicum]